VGSDLRRPAASPAACAERLDDEGADVGERRVCVGARMPGESHRKLEAGEGRCRRSGPAWSTSPASSRCGSLFFGWRARGEPRRWWLAAGGVALAERAFTFSYFIPTMIGLMAMPRGDPEGAAIASQWASLHNLRSALSIVSMRRPRKLLLAPLAAISSFAVVSKLALSTELVPGARGACRSHSASARPLRSIAG
jgi:hypothetical protein